jgi:hypothetical protein
MGANTNVRNPFAAVSVLEHARDACINLKPMACPMTELELRQRAEVVAHVIQARRKLQLLRDRSERLRGDLERFKARRQAMKE